MILAATGSSKTKAMAGTLTGDDGDRSWAGFQENPEENKRILYLPEDSLEEGGVQGNLGI